MTLIPDLQRDLVDAAARWTGRRHRFAVWLRLTPAVVVAAALIGVAVLPFGGDDSDRAPSSGKPAGAPQKSSPDAPPKRPPKPPSRRGPQPIADSLSRPVVFEFAGVGYSIVGFRGRSASRGGEICTRLVERVGDRRRRLVGVAGIAVLDAQDPSRVVLSEPWSPEPWQGEPIRFFLVLIDTPPDRAPDAPFKNHPRLEARLTSGELIDVVP
jgi:hypothetical protein